MIKKMTVPTTRSGGKKIDEWRFDMPDGTTYIVAVNMISDHDGTRFSASCSDGLLTGLSESSTEFNTLKELVSQKAQIIAETYVAAHWVDSLIVHSSPDKAKLHQRQSFGMSITWDNLHADRSTPPTNLGELRMLKDGKILHTRQKDHRQAIGDDGTSDIKTRAKLRDKRGEAVAIINNTPENAQALEDLRGTYRVFVDRVLSRMGPDVLERDGIPTPDDLVALMQEAKTAWDNGERIDEIGDDEFLI